MRITYSPMTRAVLFAVLLMPVALAADNWPGWRGPNGTGVSSETKLPERWSANENIA
jgi:outer membrane protein assembly factor BamB